MLKSVAKRVLSNRVLRAPFIAAEWVVKRTLATMLWLAWQSRLHPFVLLRGNSHSPGRLYIDHFLQQHAPDCAGVFLEFGAPHYRNLFRSASIEHYDVLDIAPGRNVTIVGDLQHCPQIPDNTYDVIVCTQVLEHVPNPFAAVTELHRILRPGGRLLVTVPTAFPYHGVPRDYWRFTRDSLELLFGARFKPVHMTSYGNRLTVVASYWFWMQDHLPPGALFKRDPNNASLLALVARKEA